MHHGFRFCNWTSAILAEERIISLKSVAIFIDGGYLKKITDKKVDFELLVSRLVGDGELFRAYYYNCLPYKDKDCPKPEDEERVRKAQKFMHALERFENFEVRLGVLKKRGEDQKGASIFEQKRVDLMLGLDIANSCLSKRIDSIVLVAGDGDFLPAVVFAKDDFVKVTLAHGATQGGKKNYDEALWLKADKRMELNDEFFSGVSMQ
jgi:uncharacterized LabA/DUF88 family protein